MTKRRFLDASIMPDLNWIFIHRQFLAETIKHLAENIVPGA